VTPKPRLPEAPWSRQTPEAGTAMVELAAYGLMIFVLLIRPGGLTGVREA
jgi:branched-subunit amino acid ABC-type transport system permease component